MFVLYKSGSKKTQRALMIADGIEAEELKKEINNNSRYNIIFVESIKPDSNSEKIVELINSQNISMVVVDTHHPALIDVMPTLYPLAISGIIFTDIGKMYEEVFDRIPLSLIRQSWFVEHMSSSSPRSIHDVIKRLIDIFSSFVAVVISLVFYPFVIIAIKLDDGGVIFSYQKRVGQYNKIINIAKFRTMSIANDNGQWSTGTNKITRIGFFLRKMRIDELPQLWNVLRGDISLIGPRPEFPEPVKRYSEEISYYNFRHIIKPGLSGWAQIYGEHPHHGVDIEKTSNKLSYDLYYIKHRSFLLDIKIFLRTIKTLLTFVGR
jgi:lipopolysaccharide/colanic/teichoic acid biosynthesis glycosyltransferase